MNSLDQKGASRGAKSRAKAVVGPFLGWDGEGISKTQDSQQDYVLFGCTESYIYDGEGLSTEDCLRHITNVGSRRRDAIHVVYGGTYDFQQILKDLPPPSLNRAFRGGQRTWFGDYNIQVMPKRMFNVRWMPLNPETKLHEPVEGYDWVTIYDVVSFFQTSFVKACKKYGVGTDEQLAEMLQTKNLRGSFTNDMIKTTILPYWRQEVKFLEQLMEQLRADFAEQNWRPNHWYGPGALANVVYKRYNVRKYMDQGTDADSHDVVNRAAQHAYMGGRFEQFKVGRFEGKTYHYDINSAYPAAMVDLPSLRGATWTHRHVKRNCFAPVRPFSLYRVRFKSWPQTKRSALGHRPFPLWARNAQGGCQYGPGVENWVWTPEYQQALRHHPDDVVSLEWIEFHPGEDVYPFRDWVPYLYELRRQYKEQGNGAERAVKLAINSLYGKMAQQVGARRNRDGTWKLPSYHQLEWAGYVTSATRAKLYAAAMAAPDDIIAFETDAVFSISPLDHLPISGDLGDWGSTELTDLAYAQTGVSWAMVDGQEQAKYRGFDNDSLSRAAVEAAWLVGNSEIIGTTTRFNSFSQAWTSKQGLSEWRKWIHEDRRLEVMPTRADGRSCSDTGPMSGWRPLDIYKKTHDVGMGRPFYLEWKDPQHAQYKFEFSDLVVEA